MALMKFAFFFLTLSALFEAYHARHLKDASKGVIQMVTSREVYKSNAYGRVAKVPPPPKVAPSKGEDTYSRDSPKAPPQLVQTNCGGYNLKGLDDAPPDVEKTPPQKESSASLTLPKGQTSYITYNLKGPNDAPSDVEKTPPQKESSASLTLPEGQTSYITYNLKGPNDAPSDVEKTPPQKESSASLTLPEGQTSYITYNLKGPNDLKGLNDAPSETEKTPPQREPSASITLPQGQTNYITYNLKGPNDAPSDVEKTFGRDNSKTKPPTSITASRVHANCDGRYNLKGPNDAPSDVEKTFGRDNPNRSSSDKGQIFSYYLNSYVMRLLNIWS